MANNVVLIGYMGAGKTTLGKALAHDIGRRFYDLDWFIEERTGKTIPQIFTEHGEQGFRNIEKEMLHEVLKQKDIVLSVGGGTPCFFDNIGFMNKESDTIYLQASIPTLMSHIRMGGSKRPLVDGKTDDELKAYISDSLKEREKFYLQANHKINIETITSENQIQHYVDAIKRIIGK